MLISYINRGKKVIAFLQRSWFTKSYTIKELGKKYNQGDSFEDFRGRASSNSDLNSLKGRQKTNFNSIEEERDYYKAQVDYLKERYPNLHGEGLFQRQDDLK